MGYAPSGFEIGNVFDARAYPVARRSRTGPPSPGGGVGGAEVLPGTPTPPQSFVFGFVLGAGSQQRSTTSSPRLRGPSIIRGLHFSKSGTPDAVQGIVLGKAFSSVSEVNVAIATALPFQPLFTGLPGAGSALGAPHSAVTPVDLQASLLDPNDNLSIIILDRDWFLTVTQANDVTATPDQYHGYVVVLDQVPLEQLALYLG